MKAEDLRKLLEEANDKLSVFASEETLKECDLNEKELFELINDFLSDEDKHKLLNYSHFQKLEPKTKSRIIGLISDRNITLQILTNENIVSDLPSYTIIDFIKKLSDDGKQKLLYSQDFLEKRKFLKAELTNIISSFGNEAKAKILVDRELITEKLHLLNFEITKLAKQLPTEQSKIDVIETHELENHLTIEIVNTFSSETKIQIALEEKRFNKREKIEILKSLDVNILSEFLVSNKEFCAENNIHLYEVVKGLNSDQQEEFVAKIEEIDLELNEKREILATLKNDVKQRLDTQNFCKEYKSAIDIQTNQYTGKIILDLEGKLEDYRGLDNLMTINAEKFTSQQKDKFMQLCDICPNLQVCNILNNTVEYYSTVGEYKKSEEWIDSVIGSLNPEYTKAQKMAVIDHSIGKKISYSPDFDTEVFDSSDTRSLWKIISSGYGVCNGIARVEQYIFDRIGIESEMISSGTHSFLKVKDIELPLANGENVKGNTIVDPTWNLSRHRFDGKPDNFCIDYEQARKNDVDIDGKDHHCHKNDEALQDASLNLDEESLRQLFTSVELADKNGQFPVSDLIEKSKLLDEIYEKDPNQSINEQFLLLSKICPEFATCQNSSMNILKDVLLNNKNLKFNKSVANRVYSRDDEEKKPILFVYADSDELGKKFYFADRAEGKFIELPQEEFIEQFECYEVDIQKHKRI